MASKSSSFVRNATAAQALQVPGLKPGPNGLAFISSGIAGLDKILGGGFALGTVVMIMEDPDTPLHLLLLRNFMAQGLVHHHSLLFASPFKNPQAFLGTLPSPVLSKDQNHELGLAREQAQEKNLRIAWQYKKYFGEQQLNESHGVEAMGGSTLGSDGEIPATDAGFDVVKKDLPFETEWLIRFLCADARLEYCKDFDLCKPLDMNFFVGQHVMGGSTLSIVGEILENDVSFDVVKTALPFEIDWLIRFLCADYRPVYCNDFDLRKPLERKFIVGQHVECISIQESPDLTAFRDRCSAFLAQVSRTERHITCVGRIALQSFCAPQCRYSNNDWDMLSFIKSLRSTIRSSNAVAVITFPPAVLSSSFCKRWQHLADTLLTVRAIPDEDKELAKLLTDYQDMVGLLHVNKVARLNSQVPVVPEATTFSLKLLRRRVLVLERLNQAPVDASSGSSYATSAGCSGSSKASSIDF